MKFDDASWHYGGDFPKDLSPKAASTHIGMFLAWAIQRDLVGDFHREYSRESIEKVQRRLMTGAEFLELECDDKFTNEDLDNRGTAFGQSYYENQYFQDYCEVFTPEPTAYHVADTWSNFDRLTPKLDERFSEWQRKQSPA